MSDLPILVKKAAKGVIESCQGLPGWLGKVRPKNCRCPTSWCSQDGRG